MTYKTLPPLAQPTKQMQEYLAAVQKGINSQFVMQTGKHWIVRNQKDLADSTPFMKREEAIAYATQIAAQQHGSVFVFDKNGKLLERR